MSDHSSVQTDRRGHPLHTLVSWPAVFAGAAVAVAVGAMLNLLGVALGAAALDPWDVGPSGGAGFSVGAGIWMAIANSLALLVGGYIASRVAKYPDHHRGTLHGLTVWAVAFLLAIFVAGSTLAGGVASVIHAGAQRASVHEYSAVGPAPASLAAGADVGALPPEDRVVVSHAADTTGAIALWAFLSMLLGAVAAIAGARFGSRSSVGDRFDPEGERPVAARD